MQRSHYPFFLLCAVVTLLRCSLLGSGAMAMWDEGRYFFALTAVQQLSHGQWENATHNLLSGTQSRPGALLIWAVPTVLQLLMRAWCELDIYEPTSLLIPTLWNVLVSLGCTVLFYRLALAIFVHERVYSLVATASYALLTNSSLYVRHLLPYDGALLLGLGAVVLAVEPQSRRGSLRWIVVGLLGGFTFLSYPGFFAILPIVIGLTWRSGFEPGVEAKEEQWRRAIFATLGALSPLLCCELVASLTQRSFAVMLHGLAESANQGSYNETLFFLPRYVWNVEGFGATAILLLSCGSLVCSCVRARAGVALNRGEWLFALVASMYFLHGVLGVWGHLFVMYGRILHFYLPFVVLSAFQSLGRIRPTVRGVLVASLLLAQMVSAASSMRELHSLAYPRDLLYRFGIVAQAIDPERRVAESEFCFPTVPRFLYDARDLPVATGLHKGLLLVNFCSFVPLRATGYRPFNAPPMTRILFSGLHFQSSAPYMFEGHSAEERELLSTRRHLVQVVAGMP